MTKGRQNHILVATILQPWATVASPKRTAKVIERGRLGM